MKLTIVYDNTVFSKNFDLLSDWGFSCLIEAEETILFDTGAKGDMLLHNMRNLGVKPDVIDKVVISHEHYDHNGGLSKLISFCEHVDLYRLEGKIFDPKTKLTIVKQPMEITKNIFSTGLMPGSPVDEQSLILKGDKGWYILTGCSHNGVENILQKAKKYGKIKGIIGGLHGFNNFPILKNLNLICPTHCTKYKKEIQTLYPDTFTEGGVGKIINI